MADISLSMQEGQASPPCNPDLKICTNKSCMLCFASCRDEFSYGKLYEFENIVAHYYCLLLSSNMQQRGEDTEGIFGFLPADIRKEIARGRNLRCCYCKVKGATIGCCSSKCKRVFHLPCGKKNESLHQFFAEFRSYCGDHRPVLNMRKLEIPQDSVCNICLEVFKPKPSNSTVHSLLAFCCKKWFHRVCIQKFALNSGYFFKCPMCNNKPLFQRGMQDHGIFIPEQDASWELEPGAYRELLDRHNQCDAKPCVCPKGKNLNSPGTRWALVLCSSCGSQGMHVRCGRLNFKNPEWECSICLSAHSRDDEQSSVAETGAVRFNYDAIVEIEDSDDDDDDVQIVSSSSGNEDDEGAIVCIDDEGGSPLQLVRSDTTLATPGGGAISVMTITASDKIAEVVGDLNVVQRQQRIPNPPYCTPHIVSVVGRAQMIDDDDDVVIEVNPPKLPDTRTAVESAAEDIPPPKRVKTAAEPCAGRTAATPSRPAASSAGVTSPELHSLGITRQLQNMIIVSPANSALAAQQSMGQVQLMSSPQQPATGDNRSQAGHISIPVAGVDGAGGVINLQVMFPPGGMINLVQAPFTANSSQMAQVQTLQFIQGVFPNTNLPVSSQPNPSVSEPSPLQSNSIPLSVSREPPPLALIPQQTRPSTTSSHAASVTSPAPSSEVTRRTTSSLDSIDTADKNEDEDEEDVLIVKEFPPDVNNRSLLKPSRGSPLGRQPRPSEGVDAPDDDVVLMIDATGKESFHMSDICSSQNTQDHDVASGEDTNSDGNSRLAQKDLEQPGSSQFQQSADSGKVSGAPACSPDASVPEHEVHAEEAPGEQSNHCLPQASPAGPSSSEGHSAASHQFASSKKSRNNRTELIPAFIPISGLQFSHLSDSRVKVIVNKEFVIPVTKDANCSHNTPNRRRSQNSRYATDTRKQSYRSKLLSTHFPARNPNFSGERLVMRPISDLKTNSPSKPRCDQGCLEPSGEKSQQGSLIAADVPTASVDNKKPIASGDGQENVSPAEVCDNLNVILEKMDSEMFENEGAVKIGNFRSRGRGSRRKKRKYPHLNWSTYPRKRKYQ